MRQHAGDGRGHEGRDRTAKHGAQAKAGEIGAALRRQSADPADLAAARDGAVVGLPGEEDRERLDEVAAAVARTTTWTATDTIHRELPLAEEEFTDGRQFLDLDSLKIETLMPGDQINVRVDEQAKDYKVTIDRIEKHDYNSISWYGHITGDDGHKYQVSVTRGEHLTVGGLDTPDGHFVIQAHGNKGWIASSQLLFKADTSVSDAIHPADVDPNYTHPAHVH